MKKLNEIYSRIILEMAEEKAGEAGTIESIFKKFREREASAEEVKSFLEEYEISDVDRARFFIDYCCINDYADDDGFLKMWQFADIMHSIDMEKNPALHSLDVKRPWKGYTCYRCKCGFCYESEEYI